MLEGFQKPIRTRKGGGAVRRRGPKQAQSEEPSHKAAGLGDKMKSKREKRGGKREICCVIHRQHGDERCSNFIYDSSLCFISLTESSHSVLLSLPSFGLGQCVN